MSFTNAITNAAGQPVTTRIGVVTAVSPLVVDVQGTLIAAPSLGLVGPMPSLGDNVLLLGQAVRGGKTSGSSWVCLGTIVPA